MFEVAITKEVLDEVKEFMDVDNDHNIFVQVMNRAGLSISAMALILNSIFDGIKQADEKLKGDNNG